jgi:hypothetical protein
MVNKIIAVFILFIFCGSLCFGQDLSNHDDTTRYIEDATQYIENITTYSEDSTSYMKRGIFFEVRILRRKNFVRSQAA